MESKGELPASDYFKVKNSWWDALISYKGIPAKIRCLNFIIRKTYGWQKKEAPISLREFSEATGITESNVAKILKRLKSEKLINARKEKGGRKTIYSFNKYYKNWKGSETIQKDSFEKTETIQNDNLKLSKRIVSTIKNDSFDNVTPIIVKDNINTIKDNSRKSQKQTFDNRSIPFILSDILLLFINHRNGNFKKPDIQKWAYEVDKMIRLDKRSPCGIMNVICWSQSDEFWQNNILSTAKLRKQYDQLEMKMLSIRSLSKQKQLQLKNAIETQRWLDGK